MEVKVYYLKNAKGQIYGLQMIDLLGDHCEIHSHPTNLDGLWSYDTQIYGTCDFNVCCSNATARKRLLDAMLYFQQSEFSNKCYDKGLSLDFYLENERKIHYYDSHDEEFKITVFRKPLF